MLIVIPKKYPFAKRERGRVSSESGELIKLYLAHLALLPFWYHQVVKARQECSWLQEVLDLIPDNCLTTLQE